MAKLSDGREFSVDFIGVGVAKGGTTWIADKLESHPEVCVSEPKEVEYFNKTAPFRFNYKNNNHTESLDWYAKHFAHSKPGQKKGEFSTFYFYDEIAPAKIKEVFPDIKLILCLRNPIERAYSHYWMLRNYQRVETRDFRDAVTNEDEYVGRGLYHKQLSHYLKYFSKEQIHIILFDDIKNSPDTVLMNLYTYLGVDAAFKPAGTKKRANSAKVSRFGGLNRIMARFSDLLIRLNLIGLLRFLKKIGVKDFFQKLNNKNIDYPTLTEEDREWLESFFINDTKELDKLLGTDLVKKWFRFQK